jgi:hypothetical protein
MTRRRSKRFRKKGIDHEARDMAKLLSCFAQTFQHVKIAGGAGNYQQEFSFWKRNSYRDKVAYRFAPEPLEQVRQRTAGARRDDPAATQPAKQVFELVDCNPPNKLLVLARQENV